MKTLQIVESSGNNIMSILQKTQMNDSEFVARTAFTQQMSCSNSQKKYELNPISMWMILFSMYTDFVLYWTMVRAYDALSIPQLQR